jgi:HK97 family phage portal protein
MGFLGLYSKKELQAEVEFNKNMLEFDLKKQNDEIIANVLTSYQTSLYGWLNNGQPVQLSDNHFTYIREGYQFNPDVYSCVDLILQKIAQCTPIVYEVSKDKLGQVQKYRNLLQGNTDIGRIKAKAIEIKAMKEVIVPGISELLNTPNPYQTYSEWLKHYVGFYLLTGNTYNYYNTLPGSKKKREMFVLPAQFMQIISGGPMNPIQGYRVMNQRFFGSDIFDFNADTVSHLKTFNPDYTNFGSQLYGQSPLMAYRRTITKNADTRIEANKQMKNGGSMGILAPKDGAPPLNPDQARDLKEQISSKHKSSGDLIERIFASGAALDWTQIGLSPVDMDIISSLHFDTKDICNAFHIPVTLMNDMSASTDNNVSAHMRAFIYNIIMPLCNIISDRLTRDICPAYNTGDKNYVIQIDPTGLPDLSEDMTKVAAWLAAAWWTTPNMKLTAMGFGTSIEPNMDKVLVPSTFRLIDDLSMTDGNFTDAGLAGQPNKF